MQTHQTHQTLPSIPIGYRQCYFQQVVGHQFQSQYQVEIIHDEQNTEKSKNDSFLQCLISHLFLSRRLSTIKIVSVMYYKMKKATKNVYCTMEVLLISDLHEWRY
jgi:hypothetical protein